MRRDHDPQRFLLRVHQLRRHQRLLMMPDTASSPRRSGLSARAPGVRVQAQAEVAKAIRAAVLERDGGVCVYCGESDENGRLIVELVVPVSRGGRPTWPNLQAACASCHEEKGTLTAFEYSLYLFETRLLETLAKLGAPSRKYGVAARGPRRAAAKARD